MKNTIRKKNHEKTDNTKNKANDEIQNNITHHFIYLQFDCTQRIRPE